MHKAPAVLGHEGEHEQPDCRQDEEDADQDEGGHGQPEQGNALAHGILAKAIGERWRGYGRSDRGTHAPTTRASARCSPIRTP